MKNGLNEERAIPRFNISKKVPPLKMRRALNDGNEERYKEEET